MSAIEIMMWGVFFKREKEELDRKKRRRM